MTKLEQAWYSRKKWVWLLWPLMALFFIISSCRRYLYTAGFKTSTRPANCFIIVVGNISVGGNGKTPAVLAITEYLIEQGLRPGILSRGYGGSHKDYPHRVSPDDPAERVGDEPKLMGLRSGVPVVIDPDRARGAAYLVDELGVNVIVCDDGLQHYRLQRDMEIVVMDERRYGNGYLLPMGPLREGVWRLDTVAMILHNVVEPAHASLLGVSAQQYPMALVPAHFVNVADPTRRLSAKAFMAQNPQVVALAGIGNPQRFFTTLASLGMQVDQTRVFADHHQFSAADVPAQIVVMTEKDAVKMTDFAHPDCWYLQVSASLPRACYTQLSQHLQKAGLLKKEK